MRKGLLLIVLASLTLGVAAQKPLTLNLKKGSDYQRKNTIDMKITQDFNGMSMEIAMNTAFDASYKVVDVKDSLFQMNVTYDRIKMAITAPGTNVELSSDKNNDPGSSMLSQMVGKSFGATISKTGLVKKVDADSLINSVAKAVGNNEVMASQIKNSFGEASLKNDLENSFSFITTKKIAKGSKWSVTTNVKMSTSLSAITNYEVIEETKDNFIIKFNSEMSSPENSPAVNNNGMEMKYNLNGTTEGTMTINKASGWIVSSTSDIALKGVVEIQPNAQIPSPMSVPITIIGKAMTTEK